jgi:mono/diheme cytochrome c family protein
MFSRLIFASLAAWLLAASSQVPAAEPQLNPSVVLGEQTFADNCRKCHQLDGYGEEALYPSLHQQRLLADKALLIQTLLHGRVGQGQSPTAEPERLMPALDFLSNREIAALIAYISNSWGDDVIVVTEAEVQAARQANP